MGTWVSYDVRCESQVTDPGQIVSVSTPRGLGNGVPRPESRHDDGFPVRCNSPKAGEMDELLHITDNAMDSPHRSPRPWLQANKVLRINREGGNFLTGDWS